MYNSAVSVQLDTAEPRHVFIVNRGASHLTGVSIVLNAYSLRDSGVLSVHNYANCHVNASSVYKAKVPWVWPTTTRGIVDIADIDIGILLKLVNIILLTSFIII